MPCGIADNLRRAVPQNRFCPKQQDPCGNMIIAGDDSDLLHPGIPLFQDIEGIDGILGCCNGTILNNHPGRINPLRRQPFRHPAGLCGGGIVRGCASARADDDRVGVLLGRPEQHFQPFNQLLPHRPVRVQLETERDQAKRIIRHQRIRKGIIHRNRSFPKVHDARPLFPEGRINGVQDGECFLIPGLVRGIGYNNPFNQGPGRHFFPGCSGKDRSSSQAACEHHGKDPAFHPESPSVSHFTMIS